MRIYDITVPITPGETPTYPGDPGVEVASWAAIARGDAANVSMLHFGAHTGTHVDAPSHFIEGGGHVSSLPLDVLVGEALVVEIADSVRAINAGHIEALVPAGA